jgi:hypothetical protein
MTPRLRDIAFSLAAAFCGDSEIQNRLIDMLEQQDADALVRRALEPEYLVAEQLFALCHPNEVTQSRSPRKVLSITVGGLAQIINHRMSKLGEGVHLSAKRVGLTMQALGFRTKLLGNQGRGIELSSAVCEKTHQVARQFGVSRRNLLCIVGDEPEYGGAPCALCEKFGVTGGLKFVALPKPLNLRAARGRHFGDNRGLT